MNKGALNSASGASIVLPSPTNIILGSHTRSPQRDEPRVLPLAGHGKHVSDRQVARPALVATPAPACRATPAGVRGRACVKSSITNPARVPPSAVLVAHIADRLSTLCRADASAGAARLLRMCAASSGWRPGFIVLIRSSVRTLPHSIEGEQWFAHRCDVGVGATWRHALKSKRRRSASGAETLVSREPSPDKARVSALRARPSGLPLRSSTPPWRRSATCSGSWPAPAAWSAYKHPEVRTPRFQASRQHPPAGTPLEPPLAL